MKRFYILFFVLFSTSLFAVSTRYINDFDFNKLSSFQLSNVSLVEGGGLTLSHFSQEVFTSESILWKMAVFNNKILIGTADRAALIEINGSSSKEVFQSEGDIILSDIEPDGTDLYVATMTQSRIVKLKSDYSIAQEWSVTNKYIWDIIKGGDEIFILCGNPAAVYSISGGFLTSVADVPQEQNLLTGIYYQKTLYFAGENLLYKYNGSRPVAIAAFDNPITSMLIYQGDIYLITSTHDPDVSTGPNGNGKAKNNGNSSTTQNKSYYGESALYKISLEGNVEMLYKRKNLQFVVLAQMGRELIIGTGKDAGYLSYSLDDEKKSFSSMGKGKFIDMLEHKGDVFGVLLYPSRVMKIGKDFSKEGIFTSDIIDTENLSSWGTPFISRELMPGTQMDIYTRTGLVKNDELWEDWKILNDNIQSSPGRFIQYKVQLQSKGKNSALLKGLSIPFLQKNFAPHIEKVDIKFEKHAVNINWSAEDVNKDKLNYDFYIAQEEKEWVKLNKYPLSEDSYTLNYQDFPQGTYRAKIIVRDDWSNPDHFSRDNFKITPYFTIDNQAPQIEDLTTKKTGDSIEVSFSAKDGLLPLSWTAYSINGGMWKSLLPIDEIMDQKRETFLIKLKDQGPFFLQIKVRDSLGNEISSGIYLP